MADDPEWQLLKRYLDGDVEGFLDFREKLQAHLHDWACRAVRRASVDLRPDEVENVVWTSLLDWLRESPPSRPPWTASATQWLLWDFGRNAVRELVTAYEGPNEKGWLSIANSLDIDIGASNEVADPPDRHAVSPADAAELAEQQSILADRLLALRSAISRLEWDLRIVVALQFGLDLPVAEFTARLGVTPPKGRLSNAEIGRLLGISDVAVGKRGRRALEALPGDPAFRCRRRPDDGAQRANQEGSP